MTNNFYKLKSDRNSKISDMYVTGGRFGSNGTTRVPKSVPRLVLDKVRLLFMSVSSKEMFFLNPRSHQKNPSPYYSVVFDSSYININKGWVVWWIAG